MSMLPFGRNKDHAATLMSMMALAISLSGQGKFEEAEEMHRQTLQLRGSVLGMDHPHTLASMTALPESHNQRQQSEYHVRSVEM